MLYMYFTVSCLALFLSVASLTSGESNSPLWQFELQSQAGSVVLGNNGLIYVGSTDSDDANFYAVDATTGILVWSFLCDQNTGEVRSPLIGSNGFVFAPTQSSGVYALDALNGSFVWNYDLLGGSITGVTLDEVTNILYVVGDQYISAVDGTSKDVIWSFKSDDNTGYAAPVLGNNGMLYSQFNGTIEGRSVVDGTRVWAVAYEYVSHSQHAVNADDSVFISVEDSTNGYYLHRINGITGELEWRTAITDSYSVAVDNNLGVVYVNERGCCGHMTSLRQSDGDTLWTFAFQTSSRENMQTLPLVSADGTIYFGSDERHIYALTSDGTIKWQSAAGEFDSSTDQVQLAVNSFSVFVGGTDNFLRAYDIVNYDISPTASPTEPCVSPCPTQCEHGHVPGTRWEKDGCVVFCIEQPVNGQCEVGGSGCTSSCFEDNDDDDTQALGALEIGLIAGSGVVLMLGVGAAVLYFTKYQKVTETDIKTPFV